MSSQQMELTLAIIKPHALKVPYIVQAIRSIILVNGFLVVGTKRFQMTEKLATIFYEEHKNKFFYKRLISSMISGHCNAHILANYDAILKWRTLMGPTKVFIAQHSHPDTIRGKYGITDTRNVTHGSDSKESTEREIKILFPEFDIESWYANDEKFFRKGKVELVRDRFVHVIKPNGKI